MFAREKEVLETFFAQYDMESCLKIHFTYSLFL